MPSSSPEIPPLSATARRMAAALIAILHEPMPDAETLGNIAGRMWQLIEPCRELYYRFLDESVELEFMAATPIEDSELPLAQAFLAGFRAALEEEIARATRV